METPSSAGCALPEKVDRAVEEIDRLLTFCPLHTDATSVFLNAGVVTEQPQEHRGRAGSRLHTGES